LPCNDGVNTPVQQEGAVFSAWSMPRSYLEDNWRYSPVGSSVVRYSPDSNDVSTEDEESPLLQVVARERQMKIQQAGKQVYRVL
jgi:hypothetical protein